MDNVARYGFRLFRGGMSSVGVSGPPIEPLPVVSNYDSTTPVGTAGVGFHVGDVVSLTVNGDYLQHMVAVGGANQDTKPYGVVMGIDPVYDVSIGQTGAMSKKNFLPAGIVYGTNLERQSKLLIVPAVGNTFEVDADDNVTATTLAAYQLLVGRNVNLIYSAVAPNASPRVDISLNNTTATFQFRIVGISPTLDNQDFSGANVKLLVTPNVVQQAPINPTGT